MTRLTEEMIIARTKSSDLGAVKKLNCWGSDLDDISLVRRLSNVEVLSLSLNKISSLVDFQHCRNLVELYVRRNEIRDLTELCYLQELPRLRRLLLSENPCVETAGPLYRATVLRCLPSLEVLDNQPVQPEETDAALKNGLILESPYARRERSSPEPAYYSGGSESPPPPTNRRISIQYEYEDDGSCFNRSGNGVNRSPQQMEYYFPNGGEEEKPPECPEPEPTDLNNQLTNGAVKAPSKQPTLSVLAHGSGIITAEESQSITADNIADNSQRRSSASPHSGPETYDVPNSSRDSGSGRRGSTDPHWARNIINPYAEEPPRNYTASPGYSPPQPQGGGRRQSRARKENMNILNAVLCLIHELDSASLEVVAMSVSRRIDELTPE